MMGNIGTKIFKRLSSTFRLVDFKWVLITYISAALPLIVFSVINKNWDSLIGGLTALTIIIVCAIIPIAYAGYKTYPKSNEKDEVLPQSDAICPNCKFEPMVKIDGYYKCEMCNYEELKQTCYHVTKYRSKAHRSYSNRCDKCGKQI